MRNGARWSVGSACFVYAIVGRATPLPASGTGGGAAELTMVSWRELAAVTGRMDDDRAPLTIDAVLHHEAIVEAVRREGPALPVRFGTVFRDAPSVASALAERYEPLAADLDRLGDKVELSLTALWAAPPAGDGAAPARDEEDGARAVQGAGARYLRACAAELRRDETMKEMARTVARELDEVLGGLALEQRVSLLPTPRVAVRTAYLLDHAGVRDFRAAVDAVRETHGELRVMLTGPWPPYSFVRRTESDGEAAPSGRLAELIQRLNEGTRGRRD